MVDPTKIVVIAYLTTPIVFKTLHSTLGHIGYYRKFIQNYAKIMAPLEKLLCKDTKNIWKPKCQEVFYKIKEKLAMVPILIFPNQTESFHVHVDASSIALHVVLTQLDEGYIA